MVAAGGAASTALLKLGAKFVQDAVSLNKPLLLRGLLRTPRLLNEWTRRALRERAGWPASASRLVVIVGRRSSCCSRII